MNFSYNGHYRAKTKRSAVTLPCRHKSNGGNASKCLLIYLKTPIQLYPGKTRPVPAIQAGFAGCDGRQPCVAARVFDRFTRATLTLMPPQRDEMGIAPDAAKPVQIQLQHKLSKSLCSQPSPGQTILAYERRTLECQHYQGRLGHRAIGEEGFPAISVENAVENNEFCGNRWKNTASRVRA